MRRQARHLCAVLTLIGVSVELALVAFGGSHTTAVLVGLGAVVTGALSWKLDPTV